MPHKTKTRTKTTPTKREAKIKVSEQEQNATPPPPKVPMACTVFRPLLFSKSPHRIIFVSISPFKNRLAREAEAHKAHQSTHGAAI
jgi:hypothetical protein